MHGERFQTWIRRGVQGKRTAARRLSTHATPYDLGSFAYAAVPRDSPEDRVPALSAVTRPALTTFCLSASLRKVSLRGRRSLEPCGPPLLAGAAAGAAKHHRAFTRKHARESPARQHRCESGQQGRPFIGGARLRAIHGRGLDPTDRDRPGAASHTVGMRVQRYPRTLLAAARAPGQTGLGDGLGALGPGRRTSTKSRVRCSSRDRPRREAADVGTWHGSASHPISVRLSPLTIRCAADPERSLERFWQERKCLAVWEDEP